MPAVDFTDPGVTADDIVDFTIDWEAFVGNTITTVTYTLTVTGTLTTEVINGTTSLVLDGTQYAELVPAADGCLGNIDLCADVGVTYRFTIEVTTLVENSFICSSSGEIEDGYGVAVFYRFGRFQYIVRTSIGTWFAEAEAIAEGAWATISVSWQYEYGLTIFHNDVIVARTTTFIARGGDFQAPAGPLSFFIGCSSTIEVSTFSSIVVYEFVIYEAQMITLIDTGRLNGKI